METVKKLSTQGIPIKNKKLVNNCTDSDCDRFWSQETKQKKKIILKQ